MLQIDIILHCVNAEKDMQPLCVCIEKSKEEDLHLRLKPGFKHKFLRRFEFRYLLL